MSAVIKYLTGVIKIDSLEHMIILLKFGVLVFLTMFRNNTSFRIVFSQSHKFSSISVPIPRPFIFPRFPRIDAIKEKLYDFVFDKLFYEQKNTFQYVSDLHVDVRNGKELKVLPSTDVLLIAGDIGNPFDKTFEIFLSGVSQQFKKVIVVAGNHDLHDGCVFDQLKYNACEPQISKICNQFSNIYYLNNKVHVHENVVIAGTPLWTHLSPKINRIDHHIIQTHNDKHAESVNFIKSTCEKFKRYKIVVISHYVPTFRLIEEKYIKGDIVNSMWTTNLEYLMENNPQICTWVCGHSHSVKSVTINHNSHSTLCVLNAHGYSKENNTNVCVTKTFDVYQHRRRW